MNGNFATGDFSNWTLSGNTALSSVSLLGSAPYTSYAEFSSAATPGYISQSFAAPAGHNLLVTYTFQNGGGLPNQFQVNFNNAYVLTQTNSPSNSFTAYSFYVNASALNSLQFGFRDDATSQRLTDVDVVDLGTSSAGSTSVAAGTKLELLGNGSIAASSGVEDNGTFDISGTTSGASITTLGGNGSVLLGSKTLTLTDASDTFTGVIGGTSGSLAITGGTETLGGTNTYTGGTTVANGATLALSGSGSIAASSEVADYGTFDISGTTSGASITTLSGNGSVLLGSKLLTLTDASDTFSGVISGNQGSLTLSGGSETLTGANTFTGMTTISAGTLTVNGSLNSPVTVGTAGTLKGTGYIYNYVDVLGYLSPGTSPGTLHVAGNVTMVSGSTLLNEIDGLGTSDGAGNYDRLLITGTGNQFVLNPGTTLAPTLRGITGSADNTFVPSLGDSFRIVTAEGAISGRFGSLLQPATGLPLDTRLYAFYNMFSSRSIDLRLIPLSWQRFLITNGANRNAQSVGKVLDQVIASDTANSATIKQQELLYTVAGATGQQLPGLATALAGEVHAAMAAEIPQSALSLQSTVSDMLGKSPLGGKCGSAASGFWFSASRTWDNWYGDANASSFNADRNQYVLGGDLVSGQQARFGAGFAHTDTDLNASYAATGSAKQDMAFLYGQYRPGNVILESIAAIGSTLWDTTRPDPLGLTSTPLQTSNNGFSSMASLTLRVPVATKSVSVQPYVSAIWVHNDRGTTTEDSAQSALTLSGYDNNGSRLMAGLTLATEACDPMRAPATFAVNLGVGHDSSSLANPQVAASLGDTAYTIVTPSVSQTFFQTRVGTTLRLAKNGYGYLNYAGTFRSGAQSQGVELGIKIGL
ncbi:MAG TPA: autotransporter domain-containing protein [Chlorobaculum sp.]|nr:autotransporter domain-containing protein [Chlorobaculum sp.]